MRASDDFGGQKVSVIIAADVRLYRECLNASLSQRTNLSVVATSSNRAETLALVRDLAPHVIVVDIAMRDSLELIRDLRKQADSTKVLAFAVEEVSSEILECAEAGATGYVTSDVSLEDLVGAIERIARDELVCSPRVAAQLFQRIAGRKEGPPVEGGDEQRRLTIREHEVLKLISQGNSNKEIAQKLNIAESTVKNHVHHLLEKLAVTTRAQAVARASLAARRRSLLNRA